MGLGIGLNGSDGLSGGLEDRKGGMSGDRGGGERGRGVAAQGFNDVCRVEVEAVHPIIGADRGPVEAKRVRARGGHRERSRM